LRRSIRDNGVDVFLPSQLVTEATKEAFKHLLANKMENLTAEIRIMRGGKETGKKAEGLHAFHPRKGRVLQMKDADHLKWRSVTDEGRPTRSKALMNRTVVERRPTYAQSILLRLSLLIDHKAYGGSRLCIDRPSRSTSQAA
jgi:hypothetical protein